MIGRRNKVIVLVEDEAGVREAVRRMLERNGYTVHLATNGVEGEAIVNHLQGEIDLVISDVVMPAMGGLTLARNIRATFPSIPVLLISGYPGDSRETRDLAQGHYSFLAKPFSVSALEERAAQLMQGNPESFSRDVRAGSLSSEP